MAQEGPIGGPASFVSPALTGVPTAPTAAPGTSTTQLATTAFATTADNLKAPLASPTFTGTPAAPTAAPGTNTTQVATTAFVVDEVANIAPTHRYQVPVTWYRENVAINLTDDPLVRAGAAASFANTWAAPKAGDVSRITVRLTAAVTVGTLTATFTVDGVASGTFTVTSGTGGSDAFGAGEYPYMGGQAIGVTITTDALLVPAATNDIEVWLQVTEAD